MQVSDELKYLINRRKELEQQRQTAWETFQAVTGAVQECDATIRSFTQMMTKKEEEAKAKEEAKPEEQSS